MRQHYDFAIIGGGIFGVYAALYLARHGQSVCLIEKETALFRKASIVNQARLHSGYHYPRSVATARMSDDNKARFTAEHRDFINAGFEKYYAIDRFGSFTDSQQFERFCNFINIPCERIKTHPLFNFERIEALYKTAEYSFDPIMIANFYRRRLEAEKKVTTMLQTAVIKAVAGNNRWELSLQRAGEAEIIHITADQVINATYAGSNAVNALFDVEDIPLMHEISEMAFLTSPQLSNIGLTVMDGPFGSLMPYGLSGLLSLSSVIYTHHKVSYANLPAFDCQGQENTCRPDFLSDCNACPAKPRSNYAKMIAQMRQYFSEEVTFRYFTSFFTIKSKLKANHIDDGRPTEISLLKENPRFYCIFAGKINSIYEIEKAISFDGGLPFKYSFSLVSKALTNMTNNKVHVSSEIGALKRVIIHRPDEGIARISPRQSEELLFDDIVYLPNMQEEHDVFSAVLRSFMGAENVLETRQLLFEALSEDEASKQEMIDMIVDYEEHPSSCKSLLHSLPEDELADVLITGYYAKDDYILFDPIPNFIFTRDIAVTVNDHMIVTKAAKEARFRENFLTRFIIWAHPIFRGMREEGRIINLNKPDIFPPSKRGEVISVEGGDVMIINKDYLLIGASERTTAHGIRSLANVLFERGVVKNVVQINIPNDRSYMHIDTVFTQINHNHIVAYKPIIVDGLSSTVEVLRQDGKTGLYPSVKDFFLDEINPNMEFILSGKGESPYQEREQWTDGCNLVALKPGVALTYDRNPKTEEAFEDAGYRVVWARDLLKAFDDDIILPEEVKNTIITMPSNELSRARGGSHCMTCPIERAEL